MRRNEEVEERLRQGAHPSELVKEGYPKATAYRAYTRLKERKEITETGTKRSSAGPAKEEFEELSKLVDYLVGDVLDLEGRLDRASHLVRHAFGDNKVKVNCPHCKKWSYLKLLDVEGTKLWICEHCKKKPF